MIRKKYLFNSNQQKIAGKLNSLIDENNNFLNRSCILCNSDKFESIAKTDRYGLKYYTGICLKCGLTQQYKYPNETFINLFYEKFYNDLYSFFKNPEERFISQFNSAKYKFDIIKRYMNIDKTKSVLEIGCGAGGILSFFQSKKCEVIGVDYENDHLEYARKKNITTYSNYEKINKKFDIIILSHVLEHLVHVDSILDICKKFIKKDGLIYVEVPSIESIPKHYDSDIRNFLHIAHVTHFTKNTFINFMNVKGFNIKYINDFIHSVIYPAETNKKIINNYPETKNILKILKIKKFSIVPFLNIIKILKSNIKKIILIK